MNRGRSSDSLDNGNDGFVYYSSSGSSSPTDFTSDDETSADNIYLMSGQPSEPKNTINSNSRVKKNTNHPSSRNFHYPSHNLHQSTTHPNRRPTNQLGHNNTYAADSTMYPSTSHPVPMLNMEEQMTELISQCPPMPSDHICPTLLRRPAVAVPPNQRFNAPNINSRLPMLRPTRMPSQRSNTSSANMADIVSSKRIIDPSEVVLDRAISPHEPIMQPRVSFLSNASRGMNTIAVRMCSRLFECRDLSEAIEFVEQQRDLIDSLTRIVTREAPAFRDYEISNYQTDYSVKDSFNPNFWLDREPVVTTADGNCQYHAVSISLTGTEAYTPEVRLATAVAVIDHRVWFDSMLKLIDRGSVLDLVHTIARSYSWGDETTLKAIAVAINRRIFLYTCNIGKKDYEMVKSLSKEELLDAFKEKKYRGGTGIHTYADPLTPVPANNYIMLFHKSEHFIAVLPTCQQLTMFEPYNPIVPVFN